jgi:putative Holliday junction resolvase
LGIDVGSVRVGVAACDPDGTLASPLITLARDRRIHEQIRLLAEEREAIEVLVGRPRTLAGRAGPAERAAVEFAGELARAVAPTPVRLVDERLSTVQASQALRSGGVRARAARSRVDAAAAAVILQTALDTERRTGAPAGELVSVDE